MVVLGKQLTLLLDLDLKLSPSLWMLRVVPPPLSMYVISLSDTLGSSNLMLVVRPGKRLALEFSLILGNMVVNKLRLGQAFERLLVAKQIIYNAY